MFTPERREQVRERLLERARSDGRIVGAALTGSAAGGKQDAWSDVDVFLGVAEGVDLDAVLADWTEQLGEELGVLHHWGHARRAGDLPRLPPPRLPAG